MARAGKLSIEVEARIAKLEKGLSDATRSINRFEGKSKKSFRKVNDSVTRLMKSFITLAGIYGIGRFIKSTFDAMDKLDKLSDRLGISTEALSELKFVSERAGVSFETLVMGMQRMIRRVAESASGFGEAKGALKELGLEAHSLNMMEPEEQLIAVAKALESVGIHGKKLQLVMKLVDSEGVSFLQFLQLGADGIKEMMQQARDMGQSFSQDMVTKAVDAKDAVFDMKTETNALATELVTSLAPAIEEIAKSIGGILVPSLKWVSDWFIKITKFLKAFGAAWFYFSNKQFKAAANEIRDALDQITGHEFFNDAHIKEFELQEKGGGKEKARQSEAEKHAAHLLHLGELNAAAAKAETTFFNDQHITQFEDFKKWQTAQKDFFHDTHVIEFEIYKAIKGEDVEE